MDKSGQTAVRAGLLKNTEILVSRAAGQGRKVDKSGHFLIRRYAMIFEVFLWNFVDFFVISLKSRRSSIFKGGIPGTRAALVIIRQV